MEGRVYGLPAFADLDFKDAAMTQRILSAEELAGLSKASSHAAF